MPTSADVIRQRIASVCAGLQFTQAQTPFGFELQPTGAIDQVFRLEHEAGSALGGFNYSEERTDLVRIWLARKFAAEPEQVYSQLLVDVTSLRAGVVRDGAVQGGDYTVPDTGFSTVLQREPGKEYAVLRVTLPINYEAQL